MLQTESNPAAKAEHGSPTASAGKTEPTAKSEPSSEAGNKKSKKAKQAQQPGSEAATAKQLSAGPADGSMAAGTASVNDSRQASIPREGAVLQSLYDWLWGRAPPTQSTVTQAVAGQMQGQVDSDPPQPGQKEKKKKRKHSAGGEGGEAGLTPRAAISFRKLQFTVTASTTSVSPDDADNPLNGGPNASAQLCSKLHAVVAQMQQAEVGGNAGIQPVLASIQEVQAAAQLSMASCNSSQEATTLVKSLLHTNLVG
jgi:hypothetical protein